MTQRDCKKEQPERFARTVKAICGDGCTYPDCPCESAWAAPAEAEKAINAWEAESWSPIGIAPKDVEFIGQDDGGRVFNCRWEPDDCGENWYDVHGDQLAYPVRWMPMPRS